MNLWFGDEIFHLQSQGGIRGLWRELLPCLKEALPEATWDSDQPCDVWLPSYYGYGKKPEGTKSVVLVYDFIHERYPGLAHKMDALWKREAIEQAAAVIAISQWTAADTRWLAGKEATITYPATSLTRASHEDVLAFKAKYGLPDNYVLIVGNRALYKNVSTYWQALKMMNPRPFTLCVGGENAPVPAEMHVRLNADELAAAYTGATCLVYPSLYEGFGLPVLEAYSCGCPVICGDGGALAEINEAARIVNVTRPMEIARAIVDMHDHGTRIEHILKGYKVAQRFSWVTMAQQIADVIRGVANGVEA